MSDRNKRKLDPDEIDFLDFVLETTITYVRRPDNVYSRETPRAIADLEWLENCVVWLPWSDIPTLALFHEPTIELCADLEENKVESLVAFLELPRSYAENNFQPIGLTPPAALRKLHKFYHRALMSRPGPP